MDGGVVVTPDLLASLVENFNRGAKGFEVMVNRDHDDDRPCGWVKQLDLAPDGQSIYALFEVTDPATRELVDTGSLRYVSSELDLGWFDPEARERRQVFEGLALTNRPYIKRMEAMSVNLTDRLPNGEFAKKGSGDQTGGEAPEPGEAEPEPDPAGTPQPAEVSPAAEADGSEFFLDHGVLDLGALGKSPQTWRR